MSEIDRERYRREAAECGERARLATDPELKRVLRVRAQDWLKLAYSDHDASFERLLMEFNAEQMGRGERSRPSVQRASAQQSKPEE